MKALKFRKEGCVPCDRLEPKLEEVTDNNDIPVKEIQVEEDMEKVREYKVRASPTVVLLDDSGEEVDRFSGDKDVEKVEEFFDSKL